MTASTIGHATSPATTGTTTTGTATAGTTSAAPRIPAQRRRRPRPRPAQPPTWSCENCTQTNAGRRRRCVDCGTSHY